MSDIGLSSWRVVVSTGISGSGSSNAPSGQKFYNLVPATDFGINLNHNISYSAGGRSHSNKSGERFQDFPFRDSILRTQDINATTQMITKRHQRGLPPLYLFCKIPDGITPGSYIYKTFENDIGQTVYHLRGYFQKRCSIKNTPDSLLYIFSGLFKECWR